MKKYRFLLLALLFLSALVACRGTLEVGIERTSTPTPDLGKLAYVQGGDIWVKALPDGEPQRLTTDGRNREPRWSPTGEWLAFRKGDYQVWLMRGDGSAAHALNEGRTVGAFAWAPGEDRLAYVWGEEDLQAINADGTDQAVLVPQSLSERIGGIAWSPDGAWIAYEWREQEPKQPVTSQGLMKASADGKERIELYASGAPGKGEALLTGWSGDGRFLIFWQGELLSASMLADGVPLYALPAEGGTPVRLDEVVLFHPDFVAPQPVSGRQVAVITGAYRAAWTRKALRVVLPASGEGETLTPPDQAASSPVWSPGDQRIAYVAMPDQGDLVGGEPARQGLMQRRIFVIDAQGAQPRQLTKDLAYRDERPLWSADGNHILFARLNTEDQASLWLIPAEGGDPQRVVDELTPLPGPAPAWFGYYGYIDWDTVFDWWRGSTLAAIPAPSPTPVPTVTPFGPLPSPTPTPTPTPTIEPTPLYGGQWIAFASYRDGNEEIYKMRADGSQVTRLTNDPAIDDFPSWSPDGNWIAFASHRDWNYEIYKMTADGSQVTNLTNNPAPDSSPSWSPDGNWIAFASYRDGNEGIYKMRADGSQVTRLTPGAWAPSWSPDGQWIAFLSYRDANNQIYKMKADGSEVTRLTYSEGEDESPSWSPDGNWIAFRSNRDGNWEIYKMRADGSQAINLTNNPAIDAYPSWSPDGNWIAFASWRDGNLEIYKMRTDGSQVTRLTDNPAGDTEPSWRPVP